MYLWELVALRLHGEGWNVGHSRGLGDTGAKGFRVYLSRPGFAFSVFAANLPEAYAAASRRASEYLRPSPQRGIAAPHFYRPRYTARG